MSTNSSAKCQSQTSKQTTCQRSVSVAQRVLGQRCRNLKIIAQPTGERRTRYW